MDKMSIMAADAWEDELYLSLRRRAKLAWIVAIVAIFVAVLSVIAITLLTPLKTVEPIIITVDKNTGLANVSSKLGTLTLDDDEAITQALVFRYVRDLETYDAQDLKERIGTVWKASKGSARTALEALYANDNKNSPAKRFGSTGRVDVKIQSVVLTGSQQAQVRLIKTFSDAGAVKSTRSYIATLTFGFDRKGTMSLAERWENPTGFFVSDYRIDEEAR